jgi:hypothetical protein
MGSVSDPKFADLALLHTLRGLEMPPIGRASASPPKLLTAARSSAGRVIA